MILIHMSSSRDIQVVAVFVILTFLFVLIFPLDTSPFRIIPGILMVLLLPGYALITALFPKKNDLDGIEILALSFGLSIVVVPLIGLGLNFTPFGVRLVPLLSSLSLFILIMCLIAHLRRLKLPEDERFTVPFSEIHTLIKGLIKTKSREDKILTTLFIFLTGASIIMLVYIIVAPGQGEKFTEFYILGDNQTTEGYPALLKAGSDSGVIVGIKNHEYVPVNYTLEVLLNNYTLSISRIQLNHNSTWEKKTFFSPGKAGNNLKLEFLLYKEENLTVPYRNLHLWVNVT